MVGGGGPSINLMSIFGGRSIHTDAPLSINQLLEKHKTEGDDDDLNKAP